MHFLMLIVLLVVSSQSEAADLICTENAVNAVEATEPEFIECGEWWGDCSAGQTAGAGCVVECDDGSSDAVFIHCHQMNCRATAESAQWEIAG